LEWQGRSGQQTTNVLLMCLQWAWAWASIAALEGRKRRCYVCTRSRSTMTSLRVQRTPFPSEEEAIIIIIWKNCTKGPCGVPEADELQN